MNPNTEAGKVVVFVGNECQSWNDDDFITAAQNMRALGVDTICCKLFNGSEKWYGDAQRLAKLKEKVNGLGCGFLVMGYLYGPQFDVNLCDTEAAISAEVVATLGSVVLDCEQEYNDTNTKPVDPKQAADILNTALNGHGLVYLTSWANPNQQQWGDVLQHFLPFVSAYVPQEYNDYLAQQENQLPQSSTIQPAIDLTQEFGSNNYTMTTSLALSHGHQTVWIWEYLIAINNPEAVKRVVSIMQSGHIETPATNQHMYMIVSGDTLSGIANKLGLDNWYQNLYKRNQSTIEQAAKNNGHPDSNSGNLIFPGTVLEY